MAALSLLPKLFPHRGDFERRFRNSTDKIVAFLSAADKNEDSPPDTSVPTHHTEPVLDAALSALLAILSMERRVELGKCLKPSLKETFFLWERWQAGEDDPELALFPRANFEEEWRLREGMGSTSKGGEQPLHVEYAELSMEELRAVIDADEDMDLELRAALLASLSPPELEQERAGHIDL